MTVSSDHGFILVISARICGEARIKSARKEHLSAEREHAGAPPAPHQRACAGARARAPTARTLIPWLTANNPNLNPTRRRSSRMKRRWRALRRGPRSRSRSPSPSRGFPGVLRARRPCGNAGADDVPRGRIWRSSDRPADGQGGPAGPGAGGVGVGRKGVGGGDGGRPGARGARRDSRERRPAGARRWLRARPRRARQEATRPRRQGVPTSRGQRPLASRLATHARWGRAH